MCSNISRGAANDWYLNLHCAKTANIIDAKSNESVITETVAVYLGGIIVPLKTITGITIRTKTETKEKYVVYKGLYGNQELYIRPYDMFLSEVDHEKYPNEKQKYRFELQK